MSFFFSLEFKNSSRFRVETLKISILLDFLEKRIWLLRIEDFVAIHHRDQVFCVAQVDDIVRITRLKVEGLK